MMLNMLTKQHTTIHKVSVDIQVIRIEKKQLTLSVFRQLPERVFWYHGLVHGEGNESYWYRLGIPWGFVRYIWKDSPPWATRYLVWEDSGILYRSPIPSKEHYRQHYHFAFGFTSDAIFTAEERHYLLSELKLLDNIDQLFIAL